MAVSAATGEKPRRQTAEERRKDVIAAAIVEFATLGYHGGSTETIARHAGISQPYVLRLFGTKKALFLAAMGRVSDQIMEGWTLALDRLDSDAEPQAKLAVLGGAYEGLVGEVNALRLVMQSWASAEDEDIRAAAHACLKAMHAWLEESTGASPPELQQFFAYGMMLTVAASIQAADVASSETWARMFVEIPIQ